MLDIVLFQHLLEKLKIEVSLVHAHIEVDLDLVQDCTVPGSVTDSKFRGRLPNS